MGTFLLERLEEYQIYLKSVEKIPWMPVWSLCMIPEGQEENYEKRKYSLTTCQHLAMHSKRLRYRVVSPI